MDPVLTRENDEAAELRSLMTEPLPTSGHSWFYGDDGRLA